MEEPRDRLQREARMRCPPHPCKVHHYHSHHRRHHHHRHHHRLHHHQKAILSSTSDNFHSFKRTAKPSFLKYAFSSTSCYRQVSSNLIMMRKLFGPFLLLKGIFTFDRVPYCCVFYFPMHQQFIVTYEQSKLSRNTETWCLTLIFTLFHWHSKLPSEMEVTPRYTLFTLFVLTALHYTA